MLTCALRFPRSKSVSANAGPTDQNRLGQVNQLVRLVLSTPPEALSIRFGKKADLAIPICSLAAATIRSVAATSGLRSMSDDGTPIGTGGGGVASTDTGIETCDGAFPMRTAIACSNCARA